MALVPCSVSVETFTAFCPGEHPTLWSESQQAAVRQLVNVLLGFIY